jgi:hypothetical protein
MRTLGLHDQAFLGSAGASGWGIVGDSPPATVGDSNTVSWFKATLDITEQQYIGNQMEAPGNRADAAHSNLIPHDAAAILCPRNSDYYVNMLYYSEDITTQPWNVQGGAAYSGSDLSLTGSGQHLRQYCYYCEQAISYTVKVKLRRVSGNVEVAIRHNGTGVSSQETIVSIDGVLTQYTATFTGPTSSYGQIGINWKSGSGVVEVTEFQVRRTADQDGYLATTDTPRIGAVGEVKTWGGSGQLSIFDATSYGGWYQAVGKGAGSPPTAATFYAAVNIRSYVTSGYGVYSQSPLYDPILGVESGGTHRMRLYRGSWVYGPATAQGWHILTYVINGASSELRLNKVAATVVTSAASTSANILSFSGATAGLYTRMDWHEFIFREVADNTATQDAIIEYLASWVGLTV